MKLLSNLKTLFITALALANNAYTANAQRSVATIRLPKDASSYDMIQISFNHQPPQSDTLNRRQTSAKEPIGPGKILQDKIRQHTVANNKNSKKRHEPIELPPLPSFIATRVLPNAISHKKSKVKEKYRPKCRNLKRR